MEASVGWPTVRLGELAQFRNGVNYDKNSFGDGIKVLGVSDFQDYLKPRYAELQQINPEGVVTERNILEDGDIVFVRSNGNRELIGRSLLIEDPPERITHSAFTIRVRFTRKDVCPRFYSYLFRTRLIRDALTAQGGGTNISNLNQDILGALEVPRPALEVQERIAAILAAYDELIQNNQRRIRILEEMARTLYREWFVEYRFPGSASGSFVQSSLGRIPATWELGKLEDVVTLQRGFDLPKGDRVEGPVPIYAATGVTDSHNEAKANAPGIVTGRSGTIGEVLYVQEDYWPLNTTLWSKAFPRAEPLYAYYLLCALDLKQFNSGAAVPTLNRNDIHGIEVPIPPRPLQRRFQEVAGGMLAAVRNLHRQNDNLRGTRDFLLPRLLSGYLSKAQVLGGRTAYRSGPGTIK